MKCIVTAGPTIEPLDQVRNLTNFSTGRLGTELAGYLQRNGHSVQLFKSATSTFPESPAGVTIRSFHTSNDLHRLLQEAASDSKPFQALFHAAAVSDFQFGNLHRLNSEGTLVPLDRSGKIPTDAGSLFAELIPTRKIINQLRTWFPGAFIVGWKYEVNGSKADSLEKGYQQMVTAHTDACVVNGPAYGDGFGVVFSKATSSAQDGGDKVTHTPEKPELFFLLSSWIENNSKG